MRGQKRCAESQPSPHLSEVRSGVSSSALTVLGLPPLPAMPNTNEMPCFAWGRSIPAAVSSARDWKPRQGVRMGVGAQLGAQNQTNP